VFENRVLGRIFGPNRDEVTREWRRLHYERLHDLYPTPNIILVIKSKIIRWAVHVACMGEKKNTCSIFMQKPEVNMPLVNPWRRTEHNIKMILKKLICSLWTRLIRFGRRTFHELL
jgi:hypothetical protein